MMNHTCITIGQMERWKKESNRQKLEEATHMANGCVFCKRIWMMFWAGQK